MFLDSVHDDPPRLGVIAALFCRSPQPPSEDCAYWYSWEGGPLYPVAPYAYCARLPVSIPLALHIRVQGTGHVVLTVHVTDLDGAPVPWGKGLTEPARLPLWLPPQYEDDDSSSGWYPSEQWTNLVLPGVTFAGEGTYVVSVRPESRPSDAARVSGVQLYVGINRTVPEADDEDFPSLALLLKRLGDRLAPDARRALIHAGAVARELDTLGVGREELLVGLRRVLGRRSGLPSPAMLRLYLRRVRGEPLLDQRRRKAVVQPGLRMTLEEEWLEGTPGPHDAESLLHVLREETSIVRNGSKPFDEIIEDWQLFQSGLPR